ncbi:MAG: 50S ribosomal protein L3 [Candidatus Muproteobacteria bacterium RIFCSPHIGHO2_01_FULL_65_16]|uniref:Large ribosomal subunit protein uL3 n=3 Tax=Candidatus Muproteobacteria TaxID=1817795 RepID=A0A1F6TF25_9PROT|nr:MAG: 50S ribosomal protein L3 [Candidatus Muproteobacteria bacterium RBG_16_65_31]OGI45305.1 MAG: 50S ribosomal protein L3 [Candidatus Muproteobacteria bacterium RIFCSPHIGHO2_01_FULL_65_16]OGI48804.1 MAG: 50S ribosomal protein L3 [Candidatus Muproteobacteria bacterium RIFCSPHIGHO2_02_FULL_65_16]
MALGLVGRKIGMTRVFSPDGAATPVTVLEIAGNRVTQVKDEAKDGYRAVQVTAGTRRADRLSKPIAGIYAKNGVAPGRGLWEFRLDAGEGADLKPGAEIKADIFKVGQHVDVQGTSIGKGFAGVIKRHHFRGGRASHGNSLSHRAPGSIGQRQTPGRVFPGKPMAGHLGHATRTQQNLEIVQIDAERNLLLVKGAVPGPKGQDVVIRPSVKEKKASSK